jgi:glyceraldehyde 3-phosphate dehydrogenase
LKKASETAPLKGYLYYTTEELVSSDFKGDAASSTLDSKLTRVIGGNLVKTFAWYDNEWGYSNRVKDLIKFLGEKGL